MFLAANELLRQPLSRKIQNSITPLQYADDTTLIIRGDTTAIITTKLIRRIFCEVSGLKINFSKSCFVPFNLNEQQLELMTQLLSCQCKELPPIYLGPPLSANKPEKRAFMPLIENVESRLQGWEGRHVSMGGRHQLMNSVMAAIPIHYMTCFRLSKWIILRLNKIMRDFLWSKSDRTKGIHLLNWEIVCLPKICGGLGV
jgi:hypothetical protein